HPECRCFAGTVGAQESHCFPSANLEGDSSYSSDLSEGFLKVDCFNHGRPSTVEGAGGVDSIVLSYNEETGTARLPRRPRRRSVFRVCRGAMALFEFLPRPARTPVVSPDFWLGLSLYPLSCCTAASLKFRRGIRGRRFTHVTGYGLVQFRVLLFFSGFLHDSNLLRPLDFYLAGAFKYLVGYVCHHIGQERVAFFLVCVLRIALSVTTQANAVA